MRWIPSLILAYSLLIAGASLALYYLELGDVEQELKTATHKALASQLQKSASFPKSEIRVSFSARNGHVLGITSSKEGLDIGRASVEALSESGLPKDASTRHRIGTLTHDWKRRPEFATFTQGEEIALRGYLAESTLNAIHAGIQSATGAPAGAPLDPEEGQEELPAVAQADADIPPDWKPEKISVFFAFYYGRTEYGPRIRNAEVHLNGIPELELIGTVDAETELQTLNAALADIVKEAFPNLNPSEVINRIEVVQTSPPLVISSKDELITVEGTAPSESVRDELTNLLRISCRPGQTLNASIQVTNTSHHPNWLASKPTFFADVFATVQEFKLEIGRYSVSIEGKVPSSAIAEKLGQMIQAQLSGLSLENQLTSP